MSATLVWQCLKKHNSFLRSGVNGVVFSAEPGNLLNKHSYKYSGLCNTKTVDISVNAKTDTIKLGLPNRKNASKPKANNSKFVLKKNARRVLKTVGKQVGSHRPDLKAAAVARLAAIHKSLRVKKYGKNAASGVWDAGRWKLTKGQVKHASGLNNASRDTERWLAPIKPHLQHLATASSAGTSLVANLKHISVTLATWDAVWEVYLDPNSQAATQLAASEPLGEASKAKPAPEPGRWVDRDCNAALNMQRVGEAKWCPLELCYWPEQGKLPAEGKEYPGLGYKRVRDKPPKAQQQQQPVAAHTMSATLVWQCLKKHNSFLRSGVNGVVFSAEPGNLLNKHSYKYSGLCNTKTVDISVDAKTDTIKLGLPNRKNASKPKANNSKFVLKKNARRVLKTVGKQVGSHRPDLKAAAVARLAAIHKSLRVKKYGKK
ncbi:hypothetical protein QJQ45_024905 [Haematococcus lacustris]|nr:hypothetical protein QJQ45_024905 [Haematococcus lacustris]